MIRERTGDLLEIEYEGRWYYVIVLTDAAMFGGKFVFAYHTNGERKRLEELTALRKGFNICTDLLLPKRTGKVSRMHQFENVNEFWLTRLAKGSHAHKPGEKANLWFIYSIDNLLNEIVRVKTLTPEHRAAIDYECSSFDLAADKILSGYTPDKNEHI